VTVEVPCTRNDETISHIPSATLRKRALGCPESPARAIVTARMPTTHALRVCVGACGHRNADRNSQKPIEAFTERAPMITLWIRSEPL
jgi:hypothetical protein